MIYGNLTDNGDTDEVVTVGPCVLKVFGTWGGGTIVLKYLSRDGVNWVGLGVDASITGDDTAEQRYDIPDHGAPLRVKATLSGASSPNLKWEFIGKVYEADTASQYYGNM